LECPKQLSVTAQALYNRKGGGYEMLNRWILSRDRKTATEGDDIGQTVPDMSSDDRKSSVTDGRQSDMADNQ